VPILDGEGVSLNYTVAGEGAPVTLLHGFTLSGQSWREIVGKMPAGWSWLMPDLRGHGATRIAAGAPVTMDACMRDLEMLWNHLGIERSHLVGYSMGGRLALHVAVRLPERVRSLLTIGAHPGLEEEAARAGRREGDEGLAQRLDRFGLEPFINYWEAQPLFAGLERRGKPFAARVRAMRMSNRPEGLAASLRQMGAGAMEPLWGELDSIQVPATFVAGEEDTAFVSAARRMSQAVHGSRVEIVPRSGHAVHMQRPAVFARILVAHLERDSSLTSSRVAGRPEALLVEHPATGDGFEHELTDA
jgi:2-succinyl-6-hydroxy-2,4-cyclohexadiene-1-carboxylate synthase